MQTIAFRRCGDKYTSKCNSIVEIATGISLFFTFLKGTNFSIGLFYDILSTQQNLLLKVHNCYKGSKIKASRWKKCVSYNLYNLYSTNDISLNNHHRRLFLVLTVTNIILILLPGKTNVRGAPRNSLGCLI